MELWPRQYFDQIVKLPRAQWKETIERDVPEHLHRIVRDHLSDFVVKMRIKHEKVSAPAIAAAARREIKRAYGSGS